LKRIFDIILSLILIIIFTAPILLILALIKLDSEGPSIHWSKRVGKNKKFFYMPKLRTMFVNTPQIETNKLIDIEKKITKIGYILRKFSFDELPQIYLVLIGQMSFVGPRPALYNQKALINERQIRGIHFLKPGITGLAQVNGRDDISLHKKISYDHMYLKKHNFFYDIKIIIKTIYVVFKQKDILH
tara:strand:+ start:14467 stop:15027 length:561 start_codon:yes stop_codon:yes gene_type:complete